MWYNYGVFPMKSRDSIKLEQARAWITSAKDRWRLQVLSKRLRLRKDGTRKEIPTRIRRFLEGVPWAFVKPAIDFLLEQAPYTGVIANGVDFETAYRPTLTLWQRDAQAAAVGAVRPDATYTLIQDLVEFDNKDAYKLGSSSSCSESVETDYVWDAGDIEDIPEGGQGVTYAIAAVNRKEDGTFDYQVVKRVALTQHVPETTVQDDATKTVTHELWDNVYTDSSGRYVDQTGALLDIPAAGTSGGTSVRIEGLLENADCTLKFQVVRESNKAATVRDSSTHTQYEGQHEEAATGAVVPLGVAPDASGGVIRDYESQLQPDGTFTVQRKVKVERPVSQSSVEVRVGRKGKRTTVVNTNQSAPVSTTGVEVGGAARYEKTPGGLYNNTVTTFDKTDPVVAGDRCKEDLFSHVDSKTTGGATMPEDDDHVEGGGVGGKIVSRDTDMDEEGAVTQTLTVEQEKGVEKAEERWEVSLDGVTHTKTDRNQPATAAGSAPAFAIANIGKTVINKRTPGGLYDVTVVEVDRTTGTLDIRATCRSDVFSHVDSKSTTDPAGTVDPTSHVTAAGGGYVYEKSSELNRNGSVTRTETTTRETEHAAGKTYRKTLRGTITTTVTRNTSTAAAKPERIGETQAHEVTPGGLYNLTVTEVEASATPDSARCAKTIFEEVDDAVTMTDEGIPSNFHAAAPDAGAGTYQTKTADTDEYGFTKIVERTTTEKPVTEAQLSYRRTTRGLVTTRVDRNVTTAATDPGTGHPGESKSHEKTPSGRYNLTTVTVAASSDPDSRRCAKTVFEHTDDVVSMATSLSSEHAEAGNGSYGTVDEQMDEYGFVRKVKRTTTETEQVAGHTFRRTTRGLIKTTVTRNTATTAADPGETAVGCTQSDEMTPGGRYNLTVTELTASSKKDAAHHARTKFEDVDDAVVMSTGEVDDTAPTRADGTTVIKDSTLDDYGFVKTVTRTTTEKAVQQARVEYRRTRRGLITTTVDRNVTTTAQDPGDSKVGCSQSHSYNPGGTTDFTKVELQASAKEDSAYWSQDLYSTVNDEVEMSEGQVDKTDPGTVSKGTGYYHTKTSELDDYGFAKTVTRTTTEKNVPDARINFEADHFHKTEVRTDANKSSPDTTAVDELAGGSHGLLTTGKQINYNRGGTGDEVVTKVTAFYRHWEDEIDTQYVVGKVFHFRNATEAEKNAVRENAQQYFNAKAVATGYTVLGPSAPSNASFTPQCTLNQYGLYDGQYSAMFYWAAASGGKDCDHTNTWLNEATWSYYLVSCNMTPTFDHETGSVTGYRQVSVKRSITERIGRGWKYAVDTWVQGKNLIEGSSCSVSPSSGEVHMRLVTEASTSIEYVEVTGDGAKNINWEV